MTASTTLRIWLSGVRKVTPSTWVVILFAFAITLPWIAYGWLALVARAEQVRTVEHDLTGLAAAYGEHATTLMRLGIAVPPGEALSILNASKSADRGTKEMAAFARALNVAGVRYSLRQIAKSGATPGGRGPADAAPDLTPTSRDEDGIISAEVDRPAAGVAARASLGEDLALKEWRERTRLEAMGLVLRTLLGAAVGAFLVRQLLLRERLQAELMAARERAEKASHAKSEFLANMSHELRTPLNAIIGFSELIKTGMFGPLDVRYRDYGRDIFSSGTHLLGLINDVLDLSKLEAGQLDLYEEDVDLSTAILASLRLVETSARKGIVHLSVLLPEDLPLVRADDRRLRQILINLIANAVKFTPEGGQVQVRAAREMGGLAIEVSDTGIGMAPGQILKALEPFGQIESKISRKHEGTGLGLPLAKRLVELHGGTLTIESEENAGTTVSIVLPPERVIAQAPNKMLAQVAG